MECRRHAEELIVADYRRFFVPDIGADVIEIDGEEFHHAVSVLRVRVGEKVILSQNTIDEALGEVTAIGKKSMTVAVTARRTCKNEPKVAVRLITGYLKGDKTELVVQKATELGVSEIVVFSSKNSSAYASDHKIERLVRVSKEAAKQCGRSVYPSIVYCDTLQKALEVGSSAENKLFFCEFASGSERDWEGLQGETNLVVGSEGGFTEEEFELARKMGYGGMTLGNRILRAETAAIAVTTIAMHRLGEMSL